MDYGYIYYVRNEINGKMYIGKVTSRQLFYWSQYKGSGIEIQKALKKYGRENFSIHYLAKATNGDELSWLEKFYLKHYNIPNEMFYNINLATSNSEQSCYYNSKNLKGVNLKNIIAYNLKENKAIMFNNITQFCKHYNLKRGNLFNVLSGSRLTHKDYTFWYEDYPLSSDGLNWILNYKKKTHYKTKYFSIKEVKDEMQSLYRESTRKNQKFHFNGFFIESGKEVKVQWKEISKNHSFLTSKPGKAPISEKIISFSNLKEKDNKFEKERNTKYQIYNDDLKLFFNYDEINLLTKLYPEISCKLLRQAIKRKQKTVMNKKFFLVFEGI